MVHSQLNHDCVVKLHEYTESEDQFVLFMEYANDAEYFDSKIVEVRITSWLRLPVTWRPELIPILINEEINFSWLQHYYFATKVLQSV